MANRPVADPPRVVAAVDLGSNSIKLTVARRDEQGTVEEFAWDVETVRLGRDVDATGVLADDRMDAALATLRRFANQARQLGADRLVGVATEAVRAAGNGSTFLDRVKSETGIDVLAIGGAREAELTFAGLDPAVPRDGTLVVADIGGASTEVIVAIDGTVARSRSVPIGSGRYTDRFEVADPPTQDELARVRVAAREAITSESELGTLPTGVRLVLVGGTGEYVGVLAEAEGGLRGAALERVMARLGEEAAASLAERLGIAEARARVLPAGAAIATALADLTRPVAVMTARSGIRRGLLLETFGVATAGGAAPLGN